MRGNYTIYVRGRLGPELELSLADLHPVPRGDHTQLSADDIDQASLHGVLRRLSALTLTVESLWRTDSLG